jgi:hypothetical protein
MEDEVLKTAPMRPSRDTILTLLVAAIGMAIGFVTPEFARSAKQVTPEAPIGSAQSVSSAAIPIKPRASSENDRFTQLVSALRETKTLAGRAELFRVISALSAAELPALLEQAGTLPLKYRKELVAALFERWMVIDRPNAESWIRQEERNSDCYLAWARIDPQAALDFILTGERDDPRYSTISEALEKLAGKNWRARLDLLAHYPFSPASKDNIQWQFRQWSRDDPVSALDWVTTLPDGKYRKMLTEAALTDLANSDAANATKRIQEMIPKLDVTAVGNGFVSSFARSLADKDPSLAVKFAEQLPPELRLFPLIAAGSAWAKTDPIAALWTSTYILGDAMVSQPAQTAEWLLALPEGSQRDLWLGNALFMARGKADGELAWKLFNGLSPEAQSRSAFGMGVKLVSNNEFPAFDNWASMFPNESLRARAFSGAVESIFFKTPERAELIVADLPAGPTRDQALHALSRGKAYGAPLAAASNALEIHDPIVRYDALDDLMNSWMGRDQQSAEAWLDTQSDLPREWVTEWLAIKPER